jgi:hypothetical protein
MATSVVQSGNYDLRIATGFLVDAFTLGDSLKGVLGNTNYVLGGTTEFASVLDSCLNVNVRRGRRDIGDQFAAGTMAFTIQDTTGVFSPFDQNSPYYDTPQAKPGLAPLREVELVRYDASNNEEFLFRGKIVNYDYSFALDGLDTVTVYCADNFYLLAQTVMDELNVTSETSGERIETILDLPEVSYPSGPTARNIDPGTVNLGHDNAYKIAAGTNVLGYLSQINETAEFGRLFMSRDGVLTFQPRIGATISGSVADFHDDGSEIPYDELGITFEADAVTNRTYVQGLNGTEATADDATSQATYFIQADSITNSLLHDATEIQDAATYLLDGEPEARYNSVGTSFTSLSSAQRDTVAIIDIGDTITIQKTFNSGTGTTSLAQELAVEGVEHNLNFRTGHRISLFTSPTQIVYQLILGDLVYGIIGTTNVLG